jgi:hypothetical protein
MRLHDWGVFAVTLMVFGTGADDPGSERKLLRVEVLPLMSATACGQTADLARAYLVPTIPGAERVAYVCHSALREAELHDMQHEAAASNARRADAAAERN